MSDVKAASTQVPSWRRWSIQKDFLAPGNVWHVRHDCGWKTTVDLSQDPTAVIDAERAHEQEGCPDAG